MTCPRPPEERRVLLVYRILDASVEHQVLGDDCRIVLDDGHRERIEYYDTFDFRLFNGGYALESHDGRLFLREVNGERIRYNGPTPERLEGLLPWELPSPLRGILEKTLALRALGQVGTATILRRRGRIEDDNRKTIARVELEEVRSATGNEGGARFLLVFPLRGYDRDVAELFARANGAVRSESPGSIVAAAAGWHGRGPDAYCSRPVVPLTPETSAARALADLLAANLAVIRQNEGGIIADTDSEFLHDYRVALRRMRSLLPEFRSTVDIEIFRELSRRLKVVASATGPLRDLDVLLLCRQSYTKRVPPELREGIDSYFRRAAEERAIRYRELKEYLASKEYEWEINRIEALIEALGAGPAGDTLRKSADRSLSRRLRRVEKGLVSLSGADASEIARHRVRIECKKLRYLLEAVSPVYPEKSVDRAIRELKRFQDALGRLQDVAVQQESLLAIIHGDETTQPRVAAAIGALVSTLSEESNAFMDGIDARVKTYRRQIAAARRRLIPAKEKRK